MHTVRLLLKRFLKTGESMIAIHRAFRAHFKLHRNDAVLDRNFKTVTCVAIIDAPVFKNGQVGWWAVENTNCFSAER